MKSSPLILALILSCGSLGLTLRASDEVLLDFMHMERKPDGTYQNAYSGHWDDWGDNRKVYQMVGKGIFVNHAGSKGGLGDDNDIGVGSHTAIKINYVIGNGNQAAFFIFKLIDRDGTEAVWELPLKGQPTGALLSVLLDVNKPSRYDKPGKTPGLNTRKLDTWQFAGDYQGLPIEVLIQKVIGTTMPPLKAGG